MTTYRQLPADWRDSLAKHIDDRSHENSHSRVGNGREQGSHREPEDRHGEPKKKQREKRFFL